jgi:hypothetical protein
LRYKIRALMLILRLKSRFMIQKDEIEFEFRVSACKATLLRLLRYEVQWKKNPNS